jgi:hypothetical protein
MPAVKTITDKGVVTPMCLVHAQQFHGYNWNSGSTYVMAFI